MKRMMPRPKRFKVVVPQIGRVKQVQLCSAKIPGVAIRSTPTIPTLDWHDTTMTIPEGNYTETTLAAALQTVIRAAL